MHLRGKEISLKSFRNVLKYYLRTKKGVNGILLEYIICKNDEAGLTGIICATEHESLVVTTPLEGEAFEADNCKIWSALKGLMLKVLYILTLSHLDRMRNGRKAIKSL